MLGFEFLMNSQKCGFHSKFNSKINEFFPIFAQTENQENYGV